MTTPPTGPGADQDDLHIRGCAKRKAAAAAPPQEEVETPRWPPTTIPAHLRPPPRAYDQEAEWGLGTEVHTGVDAELACKLAHFHELKQKGKHFNATLARNRAFHNPHIYTKLVEWAELDEHASNYVPIARAQGEVPSWDVTDPDVLQHGKASKLGMWAYRTDPAAEQQKVFTEQKLSSRSHVEFRRGR